MLLHLLMHQWLATPAPWNVDNLDNLILEWLTGSSSKNDKSRIDGEVHEETL
ncbi:hypothetical protein [Neoactinobaculum massilliense]|uniref:hypothetical protein n=1 Tax=Neoactinobaculum massilliense TaxID=2364794 RepID=UPI0013DDF016|nr:hypothetical protein [Neoactinobaculum massilliense]